LSAKRSFERLPGWDFIDRRRPTLLAIAVLLATCVTAPGTLLAVPVQIPLHINYALLTDALRQQLYAHGGRAQLWNGNNECEYLYAENPSFGQQNGIVRIDTDGFLSLGVPVGDHCLSPITWSGIMEANTAPYVAGFTIRLRVTDIDLYDRNHQKSLLVGRGFDLIKSSVIPALQTYAFDLTPAIRELEGLAQLAVGPSDQAALHLALATIRLEPAIVAAQDGVRLTLAIDLPPKAPPAAISASAAPLKPEEVAAWNTMLDNWDAFLVFAIKQIGASISDPNVRDELLNILLDSRERLVAALGQPQHTTGPDPVRLLFLEEWTRLAQVVETAAVQGRLGNRALEFLSFISAGDALFALDQAASNLGLRISADDLRRLARIMAPEVSGDPLAYSFDEDPQLRRMFGLGAPLELPGNIEVPAEPAPPSPEGGLESPRGEADYESRADNAPSIDKFSPGEAMSQLPTCKLSHVGPLSTLSSAFGMLGPKVVLAAQTDTIGPVSAGQILTLGRKLHAVVVTPSNASAYRRELGQLLDLAARYQLEDDALGFSARLSWPILLKAAAWQESCWCQYVIKHGQVWYLESKTGDIGLMQVNKYVWRGFYSLTRLQWDIVYNLSAGSQILERFLAASLSHVHSNNPAVLARCAYAAYNGGPGAYNRWRETDERQLSRAIDEAFWLKYRAVEAGQTFDILSCASEWGRLH
jgi:hypothetical protein